MLREIPLSIDKARFGRRKSHGINTWWQQAPYWGRVIFYLGFEGFLSLQVYCNKERKKWNLEKQLWKHHVLTHGESPGAVCWEIGRGQRRAGEERESKLIRKAAGRGKGRGRESRGELVLNRRRSRVSFHTLLDSYSGGYFAVCKVQLFSFK